MFVSFDWVYLQAVSGHKHLTRRQCWPQPSAISSATNTSNPLSQKYLCTLYRDRHLASLAEAAGLIQAFAMAETIPVAPEAHTPVPKLSQPQSKRWSVLSPQNGALIFKTQDVQAIRPAEWAEHKARHALGCLDTPVAALSNTPWAKARRILAEGW